MPDVSDVLSCLMKYADLATYFPEQLQNYCERGLKWVEDNLKPGADKESPLIVPTF